MITNLVSIISLSKMRVKNYMYPFMVCNSAANLVYMLLCGFVFVLRCGRLCPTNKNSFAVIFYQLAIWYYLTSCLALFINLNEIVMCLQRYSYISNLDYFRFENFKVTCSIFILVSFLNYAPRFFFNYIKKVDNLYFFTATEFKSSTVGIALNIASSLIRGPVVIVIIITINILTDLKFAEMINKKKLLTEKNRQLAEGEN